MKRRSMLVLVAIAPATAAVRPAQARTVLKMAPGLKVTEHTSYRDSEGYPFVVGVLKNTGTTLAREPVVETALIDTYGKKAGGGSTGALKDVYLAPGKDTGFIIKATSPTGAQELTDWVRTEFTVKAAAASDARLPLTGLTLVSSKDVSQSAYDRQIEAVVANNSGKQTTSIRLWGIAYGKDGKIADANPHYEVEHLSGPTSPVRGNLAPGETGRFIVRHTNFAPMTRHEFRIFAYSG